MKGWNALIICAGLASCTPLSHAQSDPGLVGNGDWVGPLEIRFADSLVENSPITAHVPSDGCMLGGPGVDPDMTTISRDESNVMIDFFSNVIACFKVPVTVFNFDQPLGSFAAGSYAVTARYHYIEDPDGSPFAVLSATMNVGRGNGSPSILPILSGRSLLLLALAVGIIGLIQIRTRRLRI